MVIFWPVNQSCILWNTCVWTEAKNKLVVVGFMVMVVRRRLQNQQRQKATQLDKGKTSRRKTSLRLERIKQGFYLRWQWHIHSFIYSNTTKQRHKKNLCFSLLLYLLQVKECPTIAIIETICNAIFLLVYLLYLHWTD